MSILHRVRTLAMLAVAGGILAGGATSATYEDILSRPARYHLAGPSGTQAFDANGDIFGVAPYGGGNWSNEHRGAIYELIPPATGQSRWSVKTIYLFTAATTPDIEPVSVTFLDNSGILYGTTSWGAIFTLTPPSSGDGPWTYQRLYTERGTAPNGLVMDAAGAIYGVVPFGDAANCGHVFKLSPPGAGGTAWTETVLHAFSKREGRLPGPITLDPATGILYGALNDVGASQSDDGAVYALSPLGSDAYALKWVHRFSGSDGKYPAGGLLRDATGALYGVTGSGGANQLGTVYRLQPSAGGTWEFQDLHDFAGKDGYDPLALTSDSAGTIYGVTASGGERYDPPRYHFGRGTVFALSQTGNGWSETVLHDFGHGESEPVNLALSPFGALVGTVDRAPGGGSVFAVTP